MLSVEKVTSQHRSLEIAPYHKKVANFNSEQAAIRTSLNDGEVPKLPTNADSIISAVTSSLLTSGLENFVCKRSSHKEGCGNWGKAGNLVYPHEGIYRLFYYRFLLRGLTQMLQIQCKVDLRPENGNFTTWLCPSLPSLVGAEVFGGHAVYCVILHDCVFITVSCEIYIYIYYI